MKSYSERISRRAEAGKEYYVPPSGFAAEARYHLATAIEGVKLARELLHSKLFEPYRGKEWWPGPEARHDEDIAEHIRLFRSFLEAKYSFVSDFQQFKLNWGLGVNF